MRKIIAIGGEPATGKSTLMKKFLKMIPGGLEEKEPVKLVPSLYASEPDLYILGRYPDGEPFGGTDRFSMAVQPAAVEFVNLTGSNILFEGDRIFNQSFLELLADLPDTELKILFITAHDHIIHSRHIERADTQSAVFKKGRATKISNLRSNMTLMGYSEALPNNNEVDQTVILNWLHKELIR
jgi:hypothetical protein